VSMSIDDVKKIFEIVAIVIAGLWAYFGYRVLKHREKAVAELRKLDLESKKIELESRKLEHDVRRVAVIQTEVCATSSRAPDNKGFLILCSVTLSNSGGRDTRIRWKGEQPALLIRRAFFTTDATPTFQAPAIEVRVTKTSDPNVEAVSHVLRAGATERLAFAVQVVEPGVYLLSFRGVVSEEERTPSVEAGVAPTNPVTWTGKKYLVVGP